MRRRFFPNLIGDTIQHEERLRTVESVMRIIGFSPEQPYTLNVNDGTRNRVRIGKINGDYGISIVDNAGNAIILANGTIIANAIKSGTLDCSLITVTNLNAGAITTGTLSASYIQGGTLDCSKMTVVKLNAGSITVGTFVSPNDRFINGSLSGVKITDGTIVANKLVAYTITANYIASGAITADKIQTGAVIAGKIAANAVGADQITANAITSDKISAGAVTATKISADTIEAGHIKANAITTTKINGLAVTNEKIANATIENAKIANISADKLTAGTIYVGQSGRPGLIVLNRNGSDGFLTWDGGNKIWSDGSQYMGFTSNGKRFYFYTGSANLYALFQRGQPASFYSGLAVNGGGITLQGDLRFSDTEHHVKNIDGLVGANDIRYVLGNDSYYHSFCNAGWNEHAWITAGGGLEIDGNFIAHGSKSFMIKHPEDEDKYIRYSANESPEVALKIRGKDKLKNGEIKIKLPHHWELVTEENGLITAQVTPLGDCNGLHVLRLSYNSFEVKENQNGKSNVDFCWEITAVRKGFKDFKVEPTKEELLEEKVNNIIDMENEEKIVKRSTREMPDIKRIYKKMTGKEYQDNKKLN